MKKEILDHILGPGDPSYFIAAVFYAAVGIVVSLLFSSTKRDQSKPETPNTFSWYYLLWDNAKRIVLSVLLVLITLRFSREFIGADLTMFTALLVGLGWDRLSSYIKDKTDFLKTTKQFPGEQ